MVFLIITNALVSKGYNGTAAVRFSPGGETVRFRVGCREYNGGEYRWKNWSIRATGSICNKIQQMHIKEGSVLNIIGRYDEETWTDQGVEKVTPVVLASSVEFTYGGKHEQNHDEMPESFQGFKPFNEKSDFFPVE